jgi:dUTP pyrophosphatase
MTRNGTIYANDVFVHGVSGGLGKLQYKLLTDTAIAPTRSHAGDLGYDLYSDLNLPISLIHPGETKKIPTGVAFNFPIGWGGIIKDRSSVVTSTTLATVGGVIDMEYTGEIQVVFMNYGAEPMGVPPGWKMAQMVLVPVINFELTQVEELTETSRGDSGFGSTGE